MKALLQLAAVLALAYLAFVAFVWLVQRRLQYFPIGGPVPVPAGAAWRGVEEVELVAADGVRLKAWYWPGEEAERAIVLFHGNGGHRGHRAEWMAELRSLGPGVLALDYRGYGGSEGSPSEEGFLLDGEAALGWLEGRGVRQRVLFGESMGTGVAVPMAARHGAQGVIAQSAALSFADVARKAYPFLPVGLLMRDPFDSSEAIAAIGCPLLVIHGTRDRIVPIQLGRELFEAAAEPKEWYPLERAGHNDVPDVGGAAYLRRIGAFLERIGGPGD